jgi:arsenate reductase-like glutaredoxin family protein
VNALNDSHTTSSDSQTPEATAKKHKQFSPKMSDPNLKQILEKISADIANLTKETTEIRKELPEINKKVDSIDRNITNINAEMASIQSETLAMKKQVADVCFKQQAHDAALQKLNALINAQEQQALENQVAIFNLPLDSSQDTLLPALTAWSNNVIQSQMVRRVSVVPAFNRTSKTAFITFWSERDKVELMKHVKMKQTDVNGRYKPVLADSIFNPQRRIDFEHQATTIQFRTPMTKTNREIFNFLRSRTKGSNSPAFIMNGQIQIRVGGRGNKAQVVSSIVQAEDIIRQLSTSH